MSIKQNGGVFGRNPTFNDVTIEGDLIINGEVFTGLDFQGSWNASTNTPALASSTGTNGEFYIVSVAGSTDLNGITNWGIGDWAIFNGTAWQRVEGGADGNFNDLTAKNLTVSDTGVPEIKIEDTDGTNTKTLIKHSNGTTQLVSQNGASHGTTLFQTYNGSNTVTRQRIASNGDISFYEDTGTTAKLFWDASAESLGIGTDSPATLLHLQSTDPKITLTDTSLGGNCNHVIRGADQFLELSADSGNSQSGSVMKFNVDNAEAMRISSGNVLVGKTSASGNIVGAELRSNGGIFGTKDGAYVARFNRKTSDGSIAEFEKDSSTVGRIGAIDGNIYLASATRSIVIDGVVVKAGYSAGGNADNAQDLGSSSVRWRDLYLSSGVYLGGTGTANKLDDYEEGTWTPVLAAHSGTSPTIGGTQYGYYTKVGRLVSIIVELNITSISGVTSNFITFSLPISAEVGSGYYSQGSQTNSQVSWARPENVGPTLYDANKVGFLSSDNAGGGWGWETFGAFSGSQIMRLSFSYFAA